MKRQKGCMYDPAMRVVGGLFIYLVYGSVYCMYMMSLGCYGLQYGSGMMCL